MSKMKKMKKSPNLTGLKAPMGEMLKMKIALLDEKQPRKLQDAMKKNSKHSMLAKRGKK